MNQTKPKPKNDNYWTNRENQDTQPIKLWEVIVPAGETIESDPLHFILNNNYPYPMKVSAVALKSKPQDTQPEGVEDT